MPLSRSNRALQHERGPAAWRSWNNREKAAIRKRAAEMVADPLLWLQRHTCTKDSHWREAGARSPWNPFPDKPYFRPLVSLFQREPVLFVEKSRDMMVSWLFVGLFTHVCMTTRGIEVLFQSQKEDKAFGLVEYARCLYDHQPEELKRTFPLARHQSAGELRFSNGGRIIGIPGGEDQIRSYHPWGLLQDEATFMPEAGECYDHAVPACQKIIVVSSIGPGWFAGQCRRSQNVPAIPLVRGLTLKQTPDHPPIVRLHYSADPDRDPALHPEWKITERKKYSSQGAWDREQEMLVYG